MAQTACGGGLIMKDNEIIKALECCSVNGMECSQCPNKDMGIGCVTLTLTNSFDLIKRQKAEIEDLREIVFMDRSEAIKSLKAEVRKEFAERLKEKNGDDFITEWYESADICYEFNQEEFEAFIDNLLKEMEREND